MEGEELVNIERTNLIAGRLPLTFKNRIQKFFGLPKSIDGEYIDNEQCSWTSNTLLCATVFLEDAVNYQSIVHKVTRKYLLIYRWFSSPLIKKLHRLFLIINLCLAFFEQPSSFSSTSDVRYNPQRIIFPYVMIMLIEFLTLLWFLFYISTKIAYRGIKPIKKRFWIIVFLIILILSLCEWSIVFLIFNQTRQSSRFRRIFRPIFMIESSQLMKKTIKATHKIALSIIACISLALIHILFFATMAMFLFPRSNTNDQSQGNLYFSNLHDSVFNLLVLYSTANNPDVMMPAYSDNRLNVLFFIVFVIIGIYCIQNIITAVVYRAFRGYFLNSIINCQLRRRVGVRASFEILRKPLSYGGFIEIRDTVPIAVVQTVLNSASISSWHFDRIHQKLIELSYESDTINLDQYSKTMELLDLNPKLAPKLNLPPLNNNKLFDRLKAIGRSKIFDVIGTILAILSVIFMTFEVSNRRLNIDAKGNIPYTLTIAFINLSFMIYFALEIIIKSWAFGPINFFHSSSQHIFQAIVAFSSVILQITYMVLRHMRVVSLTSVDAIHTEDFYLPIWSVIKMCNMCFIYRLIRFLPASKNIRIIVGTIVDQMRNGSAFFGVLFSCYYAYSILGMELFGGAVDELYKRYNQSNAECGSYEQLEYWPNGFDDFFSSFVTLYNIMIVNQWFAFVIGFRSATNSKWSELYFIFWYFFVTTIGLNICLALNGDIHDAKKKRAEQKQELIVSNMFDIYRSEIKEPTGEQIIERLNKNPFINFRANLSKETN